MPGIVMDEVNGKKLENGSDSTDGKDHPCAIKSPRSHSSSKMLQSEPCQPPIDGCVDTSIELLCGNVCEMCSPGDRSSSRLSSRSDAEESRLDSELHTLVTGEMRAAEIMEEEVEEEKNKEEIREVIFSKKQNGSASGNSKTEKSQSKASSAVHSRRHSRSQLDSEASDKSSPKSKISPAKSSKEPQSNKISRKLTPGELSRKRHGAAAGALNHDSANGDQSKEGLDNPDLGPFLLKQARDLISSGDSPQKALDFAVRAAKSFEKCADGKPSLELVMSLHVLAAVYCNLGQYEQAIPVLEHSLEIPLSDDGEEHALAKFSGCMQLGDTFAMLGKLENSIDCYTAGLEIQKQVLGETDSRVGETCRYLAEAHVQALQFDEAEKLCQTALDIHRENGGPASLEEIADRRLMGLICDSKGDHEAALEHLVLASMAMVSQGQETEVASVDCTIGDAYLSLARYDEAVFAYQKALTVFKTSKGENHPAVASVFVRLADLYNKTGKLREAKSYCENALRIYGKPVQGTTPEEIASGLTDVSAIYELMNEPDQALKLLQRALKIYDDAPGQQSMIAGIEAQMGALYYMIGDYDESYTYFKNAVAKLRAGGEKKSAFFGIALNQMGLTCLQRYAINEAADLFEEARSVLEQEYGPYHPDTLGVYSNLAGTYDAMGRLNDAIEILEYVVGIREEKLGTANPDVDDEKRRLGELLKEAGKVRSRKAKSLETLMT